MVNPNDGYDIKKRLGKNAARVFLYHAELDFNRKLKTCQDKVNSIAKNQLESGDTKSDDRDLLVLKWFVIQVVNSLADYARALQEYYKDEPGEYTSNVLHVKIMNVQALTQTIGGLDQTERDINLFHQYIVSDQVEKAINNYSSGSWTSLNNLVTSLYVADKLGFNDLPVVVRAYNNIINKLPEINTPLTIKGSQK
jgi:hypothetical protein